MQCVRMKYVEPCRVSCPSLVLSVWSPTTPLSIGVRMGVIEGCREVLDGFNCHHELSRHILNMWQPFYSLDATRPRHVFTPQRRIHPPPRHVRRPGIVFPPATGHSQKSDNSSNPRAFSGLFKITPQIERCSSEDAWEFIFMRNGIPTSGRC